MDEAVRMERARRRFIRGIGASWRVMREHSPSLRSAHSHPISTCRNLRRAWFQFGAFRRKRYSARGNADRASRHRICIEKNSMQRNACKVIIRNADGSTKSVTDMMRTSAQTSAQTSVQSEADAVRELEGIGLVVVMFDAQKRPASRQS